MTTCAFQPTFSLFPESSWNVCDSFGLPIHTSKGSTKTSGHTIFTLNVAKLVAPEKVAENNPPVRDRSSPHACVVASQSRRQIGCCMHFSTARWYRIET
jgi:hypothetical protein